MAKKRLRKDRGVIDPHGEIDFDTIDHEQFEELCYELVEAVGYRNLEWRRGGADSGRDIQGTRSVDTGLFTEFDELWFFECKHHSKGVRPELLASKFIHALAENPRHLVFFISSYPTTAAKRWIEGISQRSAFKIHVVDGKQLKEILRRHPAIVEKYFSSKLQSVAMAARRSWQLRDLVPAVPTLIGFVEDKEFSKLKAVDRALIFLWTRRTFNDFEPEDIVWRPMVSEMAELKNTSIPIWRSCEKVRIFETKVDMNGHSLVAAALKLVKGSASAIGNYCYESFGDVGVEVFVEQASMNFHVRYVGVGADQEFEQINQWLLQRDERSGL